MLVTHKKNDKTAKYALHDNTQIVNWSVVFVYSILSEQTHMNIYKKYLEADQIFFYSKIKILLLKKNVMKNITMPTYFECLF